MNASQSLQGSFLELLCAEHAPVSVYLVNGIKLQGRIESYDDLVVILKSTTNQMIYKHAISTIVPAQKIDVKKEEGIAESIDI